MSGGHRTASLVGRSAELEAVVALLGLIGGGEGHTLVIEGEAGIGKTRLLNELTSVASGRGIQVLHSACDPLTSARPFSAIADALAELDDPSGGAGKRISDLVMAVESDDGTEFTLGMQFRIVEQLGNAIERAAALRPLIVAVDDLHWSDASTVVALRSIARRIERLPVLLIGATRPDHSIAELHGLSEDVVRGAGTHLVLEPLTQESVAELVRDVLGAEPSDALLERVQGSGGNPLFVTEFSYALAEERSIAIEEGVAHLRDANVPLKFQRTVLRRLGQLPESVGELIRMASILGPTFTAADLVTVLGQPATEIAGALQKGVAAGLITERGDRIGFAHDLVRDAIYESTPEPFRRELHREFARSLADAGAAPLVVAHHLGVAAEERDPEAAAWLRTAGEGIATRAPAVAVQLFERAIELLGPAAPDRDEVLSAMVLPLAWSGRLGEAEDLARGVLSRRITPAAAGALRCGLAYAAAWQGRPRQALEYAVVDPNEGLSDDDATLLRAHRAVALMFSFDLATAGKEAVEVEVEAARLGHDPALCTVLGVQAFLASFKGDVTRAIELGHRAVEIADRSRGGEGHLSNPRFFLGLPLLAADRLDEAEKVLQEGRRIAEELGHAWSLPLYHAYLGTRRFIAGEWDDAIAEYEASMRIADEVGIRMIAFTVVAAWLTVIRVHRDDLERAEETLGLAQRRVAEAGPQVGMSILAWATALVMEARGDPETAVEPLRGAWEFTVAAGLHAEPWSGAGLVRLYSRVGHPEKAAAMVANFEEQAERNPTRFMRGRALWCRGVAERDPQMLLSAIAQYRECPRPHELALACEDTGMMLAEMGRSEEAVSLLEEAHSLYETLDSQRDIARVRAGLRRSGVVRGVRHKRVRATTGWESLTPSEMKVASLVAQRLSNPEIAERLFISRHTVESHLKRVYLKLGVTSRIELAARAPREGLTLT